MEKEGILLNSFYETNMTLWAKLKKNITRKKNLSHQQGAETLNISKQIKQYIKKLILISKLGLFQKYMVIKN